MLLNTVTVDAGMTLQDALAALKVFPPTTYVVIRRRSAVRLYWYIKRVVDIRKIAENVSPESLATLSLKQAFDLHENEGSENYQLGSCSRIELTELSGVLLDGERVIGVLEPPPRRAVRGGEPPLHKKINTSIPTEETSRSGGQAREGGWDLILPRYRMEAGAKLPDEYRPKAKPRVPLSKVPKNGGGKKSPEEKTFSAYPRMDAPDTVLPEQEFELSIGLSAQQQEKVMGGRLTVPTADEEFALTVQVIAPDFEAPDGIRADLHVKRSEFQKANTTVKLRAPAVQDVLVSILEVEYSYQGNLVGRVWREIRVVPAGISLPEEKVKVGATSIRSASPEDAPDLTVAISEALDESTLIWTFTTPYKVELPTHQVKTKYKQDAQIFAVSNIKTVADAEACVIENKVRGVSRTISEKTPSEFWAVLTKVWTSVKRARPGQVPSLLLISEDPYIPWELASTEEAWIDQSLVDSARPLLLGAQVRIGRWLRESSSTRPGFGRPRMPPETSVNIKKMALVVGDYQAIHGQRELPEAIEEGRSLSKSYPSSVWVDGELTRVDDLLDNRLKDKGEPVGSVQVIHFACHGELSDDPRYNGIVLSDTQMRLDETIIKGYDLMPKAEPFVFVNACQLGQASEILADYGGLAGAFLKEGCRGFVAPLWSVDDKIAREVALQFYKRALDDGVEISEVMRELRSKFDMTQASPPSTFIAYVFYGHPKLALRKAFP
jgi:hypothetical protein